MTLTSRLKKLEAKAPPPDEDGLITIYTLANPEDGDEAPPVLRLTPEEYEAYKREHPYMDAETGRLVLHDAE